MPKGTPNRLLVLPELTNKQKSILTGSLLGDGYITKPAISRWTGNPGQCQFAMEMSYGKLEFLQWLHEEMKPYSLNVVRRLRPKMKKIDGKIIHDKSDMSSEIGLFRTCNHYYFTELWRKWYVDSIKIVPNDIVLDELALAIWAVGDGCNRITHKQFIFCTNGFTFDEACNLSYNLGNFYISSHVFKDKGKPMIMVGARSYIDMLNLLKPHVIWNCFAYKVKG